MRGKALRAAVPILLPVLLLPVLLYVQAEPGTQAGKDDMAQLRAASAMLPEVYDCRDIGKAPVIKSQGKLGTCWALTATSALEAVFMPQADLVFSADHMSLQNGFVISQKEGGDYKMIMAYLSGWFGPVLEEEDPYGDAVSAAHAASSAHVQEIRLLDGADRDTFKDMIFRYGPVQTSLYMDRETTAAGRGFYNEESCAYYYPSGEEPTHDVLLLGWDDTFPGESFAKDPGEDGAWICQNTWGTLFGQDGIFYVSYADANIARSGLAYTRVDLPGRYDCLYQNDVCGWQGRQGYGQPDCCFANVYTAGQDEILEAVGFYSTGARSDYEVYAVHDFEDDGSFVHKKYLTGGSLKGTGYFTVDLPQGEVLESGERFAVMVQISTPGTDKPVAVEIRKDRYTAGVTTEGREGYLSLYGGAWENTEEKFGTNVCLKAYTCIKEQDENG